MKSIKGQARPPLSISHRRKISDSVLKSYPLRTEKVEKEEKCAYCGEILYPDVISFEAYKYHYEARCQK